MSSNPHNLPATPQEATSDDAALELTLRPTRWEEYVGQDKVKRNLRLIIDAARTRGESPDHLLFYGQAGLGKTTLAHLIGRETNTRVHTTAGPALEKPGDIAAILSNLEPHDILFIDEAHRVNTIAEEILYPAMETRKLHLVMGKGPSARAFSLDLPPFTIIAATTRVNLLSAPLRSRFGATFRLDYYRPEDIEHILARSAQILGIALTGDARALLARAARFTPRTANRLLKRARDYAQVHGTGTIDEKAVTACLTMFEIDPLGLEEADRELLRILITKWNGGPVGVKALASAMNEDPGTIEDVYEPFLMKIGFLHRTPAGRVATKDAYTHLGLPPHPSLI
ncbi:MAG: Holliday junction branch migration DNA helicase RuvB [Candidatus Jorgensenbacteria bacterium]|nr:Holliday junction branch migration DNA helicase RuvB [Candidatus Jorgensenbacteria bacterium]